jgi:hypothetical protein
LSKLLLYSIFHGNLNYSSIPKESFHEIIDSCYWPILDAVKNFNFKTGIEFPMNTLKKIHKIDPLFIEELKNLIKQKKCEFIFSGKEQIISPLVPKEINERNLIDGFNETKRIFSARPQIAYVHEQIFSNGLIPIYLKSKFKNIMIIYETASQTWNLNKKQNFSPIKIKSNEWRLNVIWNSRNAYQNFQKYVSGETKKQTYLDFILKNKKSEDACFPFYGSDMEIFGYKNPVLGLKGNGDEVKRFYDILDEIKKCNELDFVLPSDLLNIFPPSKTIKICSAKYPILGKKEESVVTRWAVCGRDNAKSNSICYQAFKKIKTLDSLRSESLNLKNSYLSELVDCWGSDYRTHTEEGKFQHFNKNIYVLNHKLEKKIEKSFLNKSKNSKSDLIIFNPNTSNWKKIPTEIKLYFKPRFIRSNFQVYSNGKKIKSQLEDIKFFKNGYIRSTTLVCNPSVPKRSQISLTLKKVDIKPEPETNLSNSIKTKSTEISLSEDGGTIKNIKFSTSTNRSLINTGKYSYQTTGQIFTMNKTSQKFNDLIKTSIISETKNLPIRKKILCNLELPFGDLTKIFYVYEDLPRIDVRYIFAFKDYNPAIFRINLINLNLNNFDNTSLCYSTNNGGNLETFSLNEPVFHDNPTNSKISSTCCLGSTNCLLDVGDKSHGITIYSNNAECYSVPMINFKKLDKSPLRLIYSICELDDTTLTQWKGRKEISFSIFGRKNNLVQNREICESLFLGLIYKSNNPNITVKN